MEPNKIKKINPINNNLVEVIYGDSVVGSSLIPTNEGVLEIGKLWNKLSNSNQIINGVNGKEYIIPVDLKTKTYDRCDINVKYIMRHKTQKKIYEVEISNGYLIQCTEDHSLIICDKPAEDVNKFMISSRERSPKENIVNKWVLTDNGIYQIISTKLISEHYNDYVYDISINTDKPDEHVFFANGILVHNTDSLYMTYSGLLNTIDGIEMMTPEEKVKILVDINKYFLDGHNREFMKRYYEERHANSVHDFELETVSRRAIFLDCKKRYAKLLAYEDGRFFETPKFDAKGIETSKSSFPRAARDMLKDIITKLLSTDKKGMELTQYLNGLAQQAKRKWESLPVPDICENKGVGNYTKYILCDNDPNGVVVASKCPYHVRALALRNWCIQVKKAQGELLYGGKMKIYPVKKTTKKDADNYFAFPDGGYPDWAEKYAPCDRHACFQKFFLDPLNRIIEPSGLKTIYRDGHISNGLFD